MNMIAAWQELKYYIDRNIEIQKEMAWCGAKKLDEGFFALNAIQSKIEYLEKEIKLEREG